MEVITAVVFILFLIAEPGATIFILMLVGMFNLIF